jgi:type I site-specific restriction-modification system R (restriction) subunit
VHHRDIGNQSKSEQLAEALAEQTRIIIVTIQTFPRCSMRWTSTPAGQRALCGDRRRGAFLADRLIGQQAQADSRQRCPGR